MSKQLFKLAVPNEILFNYLDQNCQKTDKYYIFSNESFKKGTFNNSNQNFIEKCKPYYYDSKYKYLDKKHNNNSFNTIIRQICNCNNIKYSYTIKYNQSNYSIIYHIYFVNEESEVKEGEKIDLDIKNL